MFRYITYLVLGMKLLNAMISVPVVIFLQVLSCNAISLMMAKLYAETCRSNERL